MIRHLFPLVAVLLSLGLALGPSADAAPAACDIHATATVPANPPTCRLQNDRECLQVLQRLASTGAERRSTSREFYAVLVNGDDSTLHNVNVERAYHVLRSLNVPDRNIHILSNSDPRSERRPSAAPAVNARATTGNLANVLHYLAREVDANDGLLVYTTGHGIRERNQSALCLNDGLFYEEDLVRFLNTVQPATAVVLMDQCFSGGFADAVEKAAPGVVAFANTDGDHETYCEYFAATFWLTLLQPEADMDGDGYISFAESFEVAMAVHRLALAETPERTQGRMVNDHPQPILAVQIDKGVLTWQEPPASPSLDVLMALEEVAPDEPRLRRSRIAHLR